MLRFFVVASLFLAGCSAETEDPSPFERDTMGTASSRRDSSSALTPTSPDKGNIDDEAPVRDTPTSTATQPAAVTSTATVTVDGVAQDVTKIELWAPDADGDAHLFIDFNGKGAPDGTDIHISFTKVATGCVASPKAHPQDLWFRPPASADQYRSADGTGCGLSITSFPTNVGDTVKGSFDGRISGINGAQGKTRTLKVTFEHKRTR